MPEINPNHPVLNGLRDRWQNIVAVLVHKAGGEIEITTQDLVELSKLPKIHIAVIGNDNSIILRVIDEQTANKLAREEGGLPV